MSIIGQTIDRYHIIEQLGKGGMAIVYRAFDTRLETDVAFKLVRKEAFTPENLERVLTRFTQEAKALAKLNHPNIVSVIDFGQYQDMPWMVMKYMPGGTLKQFTGTPMAPQKAATLLSPIADALAYAHDLEIVHRDVKPSNILITRTGAPMLSDFGIAKLLEQTSPAMTDTGLGVGTPDYMSPEQWQGVAGKASDQYSLGVVLYELVTGVKPYSADTPYAIGIKQATEPLSRPSDLSNAVSESVDRVIFKALAKNPENRYSSMAEFHHALTRIAASETPPMELATVSSIDASSVLSLTNKSEEKIRSQHKVPKGTKSASSAQGNVADTSTTDSNSKLTIGAKKRRSKDDMSILYIPKGKFLMGNENGEKDEKPLHSVYLNEYWIDRFLVTNRMYQKFLTEKGNQTEDGFPWYDSTKAQSRLQQINGVWQIKKGYEDHPVTLVTWSGALAYCQWIGGRLPSEAEWEKAARGMDTRIFPWGDSEPTCELANFKGCFEDTTKIGSFPKAASYYGLLDMAGNVWEWTADWYAEDYYVKSPALNPKGPEQGILRVMRGGSWANTARYLRATYRSRCKPQDCSINLGFRCVMDKLKREF